MEEKNLQEMDFVEVENEMETYVEPEKSGSKIGVIATCAVLGAVGAGIAFALKKTKAIREERKIKSLEKQGYRVVKMEPINIEENSEVEVFEVDESEIKNVEE